MTTPAEAAWRFLPALGLGCALGLLYCFLRPLRQRLRHLPDLIFSVCLLAAWVQLSFGVCRGDLRPVYTLFLFAACFLFDTAASPLLSPVFSWFWKMFFRFFAFLWGLLKNFSLKCKKIANFLFARRKKEGIIKCNNRMHLRRRTGGKPNGK